MKKKITALCSIIIALSVCITVFGANDSQKTDITTANAKKYYAEKTETTTHGSLGSFVSGVVGEFGEGASNLSGSLSGIGDGSLGESLGNMVPSSFDGVGDALGGIGDSFGSISGGLGDMFGGLLGGLTPQETTTAVATTGAPVQTTAADIGLIIPVPAATQTTAQVTEIKTPIENKVTEIKPVITEIESTGAAFDYTATVNPYKKPTGTYAPGDEDEGIKWLQWIFIYTHYGLDSDGLTGILDEDTVSVVKKLQKENDLTVDGNVTEDVIKAAEVLYYQSVLGDGVSAIEISSQVTAGEGASDGTVATEGGKEIPVALLVVVLVIIWLLAIGGIVFLFIFKKKKIAAQKAENKQIEKNEDSKKDDKESISSIADLFEEAEKNKK